MRTAVAAYVLRIARDILELKARGERRNPDHVAWAERVIAGNALAVAVAKPRALEPA